MLPFFLLTQPGVEKPKFPYTEDAFLKAVVTAQHTTPWQRQTWQRYWVNVMLELRPPESYSAVFTEYRQLAFRLRDSQLNPRELTLAVSDTTRQSKAAPTAPHMAFSQQVIASELLQGYFSKVIACIDAAVNNRQPEAQAMKAEIFRAAFAVAKRDFLKSRQLAVVPTQQSVAVAA